MQKLRLDIKARSILSTQKGEYQGLAAYRSLLDIPGPVDLVVVTVPAPYVLDTVKACVAKSVKGIQILSAGFRESGPEGAALEAEVLALAAAHGVRIIGPNCFGIYSPVWD